MLIVRPNNHAFDWVVSFSKRLEISLKSIGKFNLIRTGGQESLASALSRARWYSASPSRVASMIFESSSSTRARADAECHRALIRSFARNLSEDGLSFSR